MRASFVHGIRFRLLVASLVLLAIPLLAAQFISRMEAFLRSAQVQDIAVTARAVASALSDRPALFPPAGGEPGDPEDEEQWAWLRTYSPYQRFDPSRPTPPVYLATSTRDDRVHPGHARKMMALMEYQGHDVQYYENIEGGHGGAANNEQRAFMQALAYSYLKERLFPPAKSDAN